MAKIYNNSVSRYAVIACLGLVLLLGQMFGLHLHIQYDNNPLNVSAEHSLAEHVVNVHVSSSLYDADYDEHHQDDYLDHHGNTDIDISSDGFLKVSKVLNSLLLLLLVVSFVVFVPLLQCVCKNHIAKIKRSSKYYLLHPPLRAPPI